jgi:CheY-like chemotaxis protein
MSQPLVLVVEDDPILRDMARRQLAKLGFESVLISSGEEAVEHDRSQIGLIFMDIGLPGIDGTHAALLIRENELLEKKKRVPIVALTGHSDRQKAIAVGMDDFLQKPALMDDLKRMLDKWFSAPEHKIGT